MSETKINKDPEKQWWELLNWEEMKYTWKLLPEWRKQQIRDAGLAPSWDNSSEDTKNDND